MHRIAALLIGSICALQPALGQSAGETPIGGLLPDAALNGLNGASARLSLFRGRPLIINVWASWCGPCRAEMASLERLAWLDLAQHFAIIGISTDDSPALAMALLKSNNATISHFIDSNLVMENILGASRLPLTVLVGADGRIVDKVYGARQWDADDAQLRIRKAFAIRLRTAGPSSP